MNESSLERSQNRTASMEIGTSNGNFVRLTSGGESLSRDVGALSRDLFCLSCDPDRPAGTPDGSSFNPEMLSSNPDAQSPDTEALSFNPDAPRFNPEALRFDPETPSFDVFDQKAASNMLIYSYLQFCGQKQPENLPDTQHKTTTHTNTPMNNTTTTDPIPTPTPTPATKTKRQRSTINRKHLDEIANSRAVAKAALDPANAATLAGVDFDATLPGQINALADSTETAIGKLTGNRVQKNELTAEEKTARDALVSVIAPIQTAAKRKFTAPHDPMRHAYFIGEDMHSDTLYEVQTAAIAIRDRLVVVPPATAPLDVLPGIKAGQISALTAAIATYASGIAAPGDQKNQNAAALETIVANINKLAGLRHQVQLAAEQAFPWRTPGVAAIRQSFLLPADRPLPN
jgi:hypothetical protein